MNERHLNEEQKCTDVNTEHFFIPDPEAKEA